MADIFKHGYKHEECIVLSNAVLSTDSEDIFLKKIKEILPGFIPFVSGDASNNMTVYFEKQGIVEGAYNLSVFMNIACLDVLYISSNNVLSSQASSILSYLVLSIRRLNFSGLNVSLANQIGFRFYLYLPGFSQTHTIPSVSNFTKNPDGKISTILGKVCPQYSSEYLKLLEFDNEFKLKNPECSISYSLVAPLKTESVFSFFNQSQPSPNSATPSSIFYLPAPLI